MSIFTEVFSSDLKLNLVDDNSFISKLTNLSPWIIGNGQILSIPNMDVNPSVSTGLAIDSDFTTSASTETKKSFTLQRYSIAPYRIPLSDELYNAYDKFKGLSTQLINKITDYVHTDLLYKISGETDSSRYLFTTGSTGTANNPFGGNSKMLKIEDIFNVAKKMDKDKVAKDNRFILLNPEAYHELMVSSDNIAYNRMDFINTNSLETGVVNKIAGINILVRAEVPQGTSGTTALIGDATVSGSRFNFLAWQTDEVGYALGDLTVLEDERNVFKFAHLISAETYMFGGSLRIPTNRVGLYVLQQG